MRTCSQWRGCMHACGGCSSRQHRWRHPRRDRGRRMRWDERGGLAPQVLRRARIGNMLHLVAAVLQAAPAAAVVALLLMLARRGPDAAGALWLCAALVVAVALRLLV